MGTVNFPTFRLEMAIRFTSQGFGANVAFSHGFGSRWWIGTGSARMPPVSAKEDCMPKFNDSVDSILKQKPAVVWSISPERSVFEAIHEMSEKRVGALLVMSEGSLLGIVSERDYARKVILLGRSSKTTEVQEIMTADVVCVTPTHRLDECMALMTKHHIRHLPVLKEGQVVGIVSIGDVVKWIISAQEETIRHLEQYISGIPTELMN
jgi:signal-transduction protein with cAMP-binding, CBS, and nucleotidyltransferase domain